MASHNASAIVPPLSPLSVARMLWKRKLLVVAAWGAVTIAAYHLASRIPSVYQASALVLVDSQRIPERYVPSTVVSDVQERMATIGQRVLSAGRLGEIIERFDLYSEQRHKYPLEQTIERMRKDIETVPDRGWTGHAVAFRVGYQGPNPVVVAQVANLLANLYADENLRTRETQAEGTSEFIEAQLKEAKQSLDSLEAAVSRYKLAHNGELHESSLNGMLSRLQMELEANRQAINQAQQSKLMLQDSLTAAEEYAREVARELRYETPAVSAASLVTGTANPAAQNVSDTLQGRLEEMRLRYSDKHPDVIRLRTEIERVKEMEARRRSEAAPVGGPGAEKSVPVAPKPTRTQESLEMVRARQRVASIQSQLAITDQEISNRRTEQQRILSDLSNYQGRINSLPIREQEMEKIARDYEISKANYRSLLDKKIAADMAANMERRQQWERFTVAEPAHVPFKPFKPNRPMIRLAGSLFGLMLGLALGLAKEFHQATLLGEWELPGNLVILGRIPNIKITPSLAPGPTGEPWGGAARRRRLGLAILSSALLIVVAGFYFATHRF